MSVGVAIFVKTPGLSPVKTRLALQIGPQLAEAWYLRSAAAVASVVRQLTDHGYWAVGEELTHAKPHWLTLPCLEQGASDLATRMAHVHDQLLRRCGAGLLLGADLPHVPAACLRQALEWLDAETPRQAIAPATDGGFWNFGANRTIPLTRWQSVPYSQADTYERFSIMAKQYGERMVLSTQTDVDHVSDLSACLASLQALTNPTHEQSELARWMQAHSLGMT